MTFTTQILVVLLIGWNFLSTNQKHYQDLGSERHQYGISALITQTLFCEGSSGDLVKRRLFSQASGYIMQRMKKSKGAFFLRGQSTERGLHCFKLFKWFKLDYIVLNWVQREIKDIYYIDKSVLMGNRPLVKFIRNYIRDSRGIFPYPH